MLDEEEFKKFANCSKSRRLKLIAPAIKENYEEISRLVGKGYQLTVIYDYFKSKGEISCTYQGFCRAWKVYQHRAKKELETNDDR